MSHDSLSVDAQAKMEVGNKFILHPGMLRCLHCCDRMQRDKADCKSKMPQDRHLDGQLNIAGRKISEAINGELPKSALTVATANYIVERKTNPSLPSRENA